MRFAFPILTRPCGVLLVVIAALAAGCGGAKLDKAKAAVKTSLDKWKAAGTPQQLADEAIVLSEPDWQAGYRLLDYEFKAVSAQPQQGPRVVVVLNLEDKKGKKLNKEVAYEVILGDQVKIGRDAFHQ